MRAATPKSSKRTAAKEAAPTPVDAYLESVPEPARALLARLRSTIRAAAPAEAEEILSYRMPAFKYKKILVWYGAFSDHCSLFPTAEIVAAFKDELTDFRTSKGTIHFPLDKPLRTALIKKIVKARVERVAGTG